MTVDRARHILVAEEALPVQEASSSVRAPSMAAWFDFGFPCVLMKLDDVLLFSGWCAVVLGVYVLARWLGLSV